MSATVVAALPELARGHALFPARSFHHLIAVRACSAVRRKCASAGVADRVALHAAVVAALPKLSDRLALLTALVLASTRHLVVPGKTLS